MIKYERKTYIDILNIIAIIAVIALHCNGIVHGNPNTRAWNTSLLVECLCYFAVPLFIMITGANLMNYREKYDTKTFFKKRFIKVLMPFIFWSIVMFSYKIFLTHSLQPYADIKSLINAFLQNKQETTYYFVWNIIGIYLTMPVLSLLAKKEYRNTLWFTVILYFVLNAFLPNICSLLDISYNTNATILFGGWLIYVILGYLFSTADVDKIKKYRYYLYFLAIVGLVYRYLTTFILSKKAGFVIKTTWGYTSWHAILLTCSVFLLVRIVLSRCDIKTKISKILAEISKCSYGIFLIHQIVMSAEKSLLNINTASWQWRTLGIFVTYILSLVIIYILKKIPLVKKIVA